ncbi:tRNA (adenosine(37)-N6)-threonylcarbamoyltransferase complex dimerization subunit type 1 TsaB [Spirochaetia bacterium 38H-sp]|uniref:tRNA (Adenosine(37)-N6)-threonylcarbamoyltransferase complex dimerization subunit type 1 TsaB n=1 Tax=Rarispira pelagica TaxID=3141764 RepID=A0ABU9UD13_9SPIR
MKILAIDTTTSLLSVAAGDRNSFSISELYGGLRHAENLPSVVEKVCSNMGLVLQDFSLLGVCLGPGSFTGLRIGLAFIKGLSASLSVPFIGINSLDVYASACSYIDLPVLSVVDARKKRFYAALYMSGERISDYLDADRDVLCSLIEPYKRVFLTGPDAGILKYRWFEGDDRFILLSSVVMGPGVSLINMTESVYKSHGAAPANTEPFYLRLSEAEIGITRSKTIS